MYAKVSEVAQVAKICTETNPKRTAEYAFLCVLLWASRNNAARCPDTVCYSARCPIRV